MLDRECIQSRGFRNVLENGKTVGFQLKIRSLYYRGLWLSQLRPATVIVDGEEFSGDKITWVIKSKKYKQSKLKAVSDIHWCIDETATLILDKNNGLETGYHDIEFKYSFSSSYMPPNMDGILSGGPQSRKLLLVK
ncbi:MAG: hypothetical protein JXM74_05345 [Fusobacteriaceae bacterium]|nr:hypothetical protein [Fusobacteriaceae bacterium]MBN2838162.1 hypothetical protein [Fusobacteriaceae bacterium]